MKNSWFNLMISLMIGLMTETAPLRAADGQQHEAPQGPYIVFNTRDQQVAQLDTVFSRLTEKGFTGYVTVAVGGHIVYGRGQNSRAMTFANDAAVDILSITKSFTGAAISHMILRGDLRPDTRLSEIFTGVPADKAMISVHQLLTHTAGFPDALGHDHDPIDRDSYVAKAFKAKLSTKPGSRYDYSNVGFSLLAAIIEVKSGQSYDAYLDQHIFGPIGMTATGYMPADPASKNTAIVRKTSWGTTTPSSPPSWHLVGNGGMLSTPGDMMRWIIASETGQSGQEQASALTHIPFQREGDDAPSHYGYGLVVEDHPVFGRTYWHNGGSPSYNSHWRYFADHDVALFIAADQRKVSADRAAFAISKALISGR